LGDELSSCHASHESTKAGHADAMADLSGKHGTAAKDLRLCMVERQDLESKREADSEELKKCGALTAKQSSKVAALAKELADLKTKQPSDSCDAELANARRELADAGSSRDGCQTTIRRLKQEVAMKNKLLVLFGTLVMTFGFIVFIQLCFRGASSGTR